MARIRRLILCFPVAILFTGMVFASQSNAKTVPLAPVSTQILTAKKIFIANAPGDNLPDSLGGPERAYNEFYAAAKSLGRYELVSSPSEADLVFAISFTDSLSGVGGTSSTGCSSSTAKNLRLAILDARTGIPLWWFAQPVAQKMSFGHRPEMLDAAFTRSIDTLIDDLKKLTNQLPATPTAGAR
jgi:hypothetical protein